jgi:hypothetical protein
MIEAQELTKYFGHRIAADPVTFEVNSGATGRLPGSRGPLYKARTLSCPCLDYQRL